MLAASVKPIEYVEFVLIAGGLLICILAAARLTRRRAWGDHCRLPLVAPSRFTLVDLLAYLLLTSLVGVSCQKLAAAQAAPHSQPSAASQPVVSPLKAREIALGGFFVPAVGASFLLILMSIRVDGGLRAWGLASDRCRRAAWPGLVGYLAVWPFCAGMLVLTRTIFLHFAPDHPFEEHTTLGLLRAAGDAPRWVPVLLVLGAVVAAPLCEELFFRGLIQSMIERGAGSAWIGVLGSALIFGGFHYTNPETIPALVIFGLGLGVAFARTGSLSVPIVMHILFNAKTIVWLILGATE